MINSIPGNYIFQCALYKNLERNVMLKMGYVSDDVLVQALSAQLKNEKNAILTDLYKQIMSHFQPAIRSEPRQVNCDFLEVINDEYSSGTRQTSTLMD
ncbi:hypothetical protein [Citrobacter werkmanii]|uniref:hypothetical protein n=1 Tax=Citrobacter werkmanii TaxID=67827 RepID=UPI001D0A7C5D|nr:hypothetical protein [Citrobacter werkmanii]MBY6247518.1 hypothetical protein [Citrobacter werkmanii]MBY6253450.1 hypothetical protein [Citrobacter werkmanii]